MPDLPETHKPALVELLLAVADDKLILGHRNSDWTGLAPILEEDIAFSSLAQDEMAHARALYELAGELSGRSADALAFGRSPGEYRCAAIVELPDEFDWATAVCRQFLCDHFDALRLPRLATSSWKPLADLGARLAAEERIHVEHADAWVLRLGAGTRDSKKRMQQALDALALLAPGLLEPVRGQDALEQSGIYPPLDGEFFERWTAALQAVTSRAGLKLDVKPSLVDVKAGRRGEHTPHLAGLLDEMCEVWRLEPDAAW